MTRCSPIGISCGIPHPENRPMLLNLSPLSLYRVLAYHEASFRVREMDQRTAWCYILLSLCFRFYLAALFSLPYVCFAISAAAGPRIGYAARLVRLHDMYGVLNVWCSPTCSCSRSGIPPSESGLVLGAARQARATGRAK